MSEYWVSGNRIWCKFCKIFVYDNKPSRQKHDTSKKHLDNVRRHRQSVDNKTISKRNEDLETKRQLEQIERAAMRQFIMDTGTMIKTQSASTADTPAKSTAAPPPPPPHIPEVPFIPMVGETKVGKWEVVEEPKINVIKSTTTQEEEEDEDYQGDPDDLSNFKIQEKIQPHDDSLIDEVNDDADDTVMFKKRKKSGGSGRNIRKKT